MFKFTIRKLLVGAISVALLATAIVTSLINHQQFSTLFSDLSEKEYFPNLLGKLEAKIRAELNVPIALSTGMSQNHYLTTWSSQGEPSEGIAAIQQYFSQIKSRNNAAAVFWVSSNSGNYYTESGITKTLSRSNQRDQWFYQFLGSGKPFEVSIDVDENSNRLTAFINVRVEQNGLPVAVTGLGYDVSEISRIVTANPVGKNGYAFLVSADGKITAHKNRNLLEQDANLLPEFAALQKHSGVESQISITSFEKDSESYYVASYPIKNLGWSVIAVLPKSEIVGPVSDAIGFTIIFNFLIALICLFLIFIAINKITRAIDDVGSRLIKMAGTGGDLTQRLDETRSDELGNLAKGFNAIITKVARLVSEIQTGQRQLTNTIQELILTSKQTVSFALQQREHTDQVATAITQMGQTIGEVSSVAQSTATETELAVKESSQTSAKVAETTRIMDELAKSMQSTNLIIADLTSKAESINSVVDVISSISEQTNLLALNAAIEAARAGEQGRGFAVVADEVRSLASKTKDSTEEIRVQIEQLQIAATQSRTAIARASESSVKVAESAEQASSALLTIKDKFENIQNQNFQTATSTEEQAQVIQHINESAVKISDLANQLHQVSAVDQKEIENLKILSDRMSELVNQFKL